ncbi:LacI family DNA-binding transcriptional regulator [Limosilactobacillus pontis]|uniref:LacI family DNA-binding transcriptional regulator n=1 Tax=Limosilactobacillus pontis TaxID=35787 RepID=UPI001E185215|nr:LacI family DNA-binding transcriptional regulator [Limosilactobacillus pontis]HJE26886.1 LacI family DNA-binding transcriptional regulator [Limosilactobacillus pontis]
MATIKEIAAKSGFSSATVSRLLNNDPNLSIAPATRKRIMTVANELGYWNDHRKQDAIRPMIALLYRVDSKEQLQDEYFSSLKDELLKVISAAGLQVQVFEHITDLVAKADDFQGFIGVGPHRLTRQKLMTLHDALPNGVFIDINPAPELFDSVRPNLTLTIRDAIQRLITAGAHRIGFIGGVGLNFDRVQQPDIRETVFREFTSINPGVVEAPMFVGGPFNIENGYALGKQAVEECGDQLPDAFIVASDTLSVGVLQAFNEAGVIVPRDTAVISVNNSEVARYVSPPLSSYNINQETLGRMAIKLLQDLIVHPSRPHVHLAVNTNLVIRKSFVTE